MKAFKGCTNPGCKAYKKTHYKRNDEYCVKCGDPLSFVCAECWKPMMDGSNKLCISCSAEKEQNRAEMMDKAKKGAGAAAAAAGAVVVAVPKFVNDSDKLVKDVKKAADAAVKVIKLVKK